TQESYPAKTAVESAADPGISPRRGMRIYGGGLWKLRGPTDTDRPWGKVAQRTSAGQGRGQRDRWESTTSVAGTLAKVAEQRQEQGSCDGSGRTRVTWFYLGHRDQSRNSAQGASAAGGLEGICSEVRSSKEAGWGVVEGYTERRTLESSMR